MALVDSRPAIRTGRIREAHSDLLRVMSPAMSVSRLVQDIERARGRFLEVFSGLEEARASSPIGDERWSPLQYLEHLVRAEEVTLWRMFKAVEDFRASRESLVSETPNQTIEDIVERTWGGHVDAPPLAVPQLGGSVAYWSVRMTRNADLVRAFADLVEDAELDGVAYPHPISGLFTMRQGLEFVRFHLDRHRTHLVEAGLEPSDA